ncbi:MAG: FIG00486599: hypothetical protein, partial [uncultured Blastococcus sp.]
DGGRGGDRPQAGARRGGGSRRTRGPCRRIGADRPAVGGTLAPDELRRAPGDPAGRPGPGRLGH